MRAVYAGKGRARLEALKFARDALDTRRDMGMLLNYGGRAGLKKGDKY